MLSSLKSKGYNPQKYYHSNAELREALDLISSGHFSDGDRDLFKPLVDSLVYHDEYMLLADYQSYIDCQERVSQAYLEQDYWARMSILNAARMGKFSSDRSMREYCEDIWRVKPFPTKLDEPAGS